MGVIIVVLVSISLFFGFSQDAFAYTRVFSLGESKITVFAPDWIWQGQKVNVMFVVENSAVTEKKIDVLVSTAEDNQKYFDIPEQMRNSAIAPPQDKLRLAITGIVPRKDAPLRKYLFLIDVQSDSSGKQLEYQLEVIRGSLVEVGVWSVVLPAMIALVWGMSFCFVLPRFSERGSWRKKREPFREFIENKEWFNE